MPWRKFPWKLGTLASASRIGAFSDPGEPRPHVYQNFPFSTFLYPARQAPFAFIFLALILPPAKGPGDRVRVSFGSAPPGLDSSRPVFRGLSPTAIHMKSLRDSGTLRSRQRVWCYRHGFAVSREDQERPLSTTPTAIELSGETLAVSSPLPARNERGEGWGEGKSIKNATPLPGPLLLLRRKRGSRAQSIFRIESQRILSSNRFRLVTSAATPPGIGLLADLI